MDLHIYVPDGFNLYSSQLIGGAGTLLQNRRQGPDEEVYETTCIVLGTYKFAVSTYSSGNG